MTAKAKYYFQISTSSGVPIYRQIIDQVKTHIATGKLQEGVLLPSVRQVAEELEVNPMTVSKAYSMLEKEGVLVFMRGQGMMVGSLLLSSSNHQSREDHMLPLLREVVKKAKQLSLDESKVSKLLESAWKEEQ